MNWIQKISRHGVWDIGERIGMTQAKGQSLSPCPACGMVTRGSGDKRGPVGVRGDGLGWRCLSCQASGDAAELLSLKLTGKSLSDLESDGMKIVKDWGMSQQILESRGFDPSRSIVKAVKKPTKPEKTKGKFQFSVELAENSHKKLVEAIDSINDGEQRTRDNYLQREVAQYLKHRGITEESTREWSLGAYLTDNKKEIYLTIPIFNDKKEIVNIRFRSIPGKCLYCGGSSCNRCKNGEVKKVYYNCGGATAALHGEHLLSKNKKTTVIICEGELDLISLWQMGFRENIVTGTAGAGTFKDEWLDALEPYRDFVIVYDDDEAGNVGASRLSKKLGKYRCGRADLRPYKDPNDYLMNNVPPEEMAVVFDNASPMMDARLKRVDDYTQELEELINNPLSLKGRSTGNYDIDDAMGGWRPGLVIFTGDTASGKTTLTTWLAHEQAKQNVGVMLTSYEQRPIGTVQKLMRLECGDFTRKTHSERQSAYARLSNMPLYILDHYGEMDFEKLVEVIKYAVRRLDVQWFLVDHLGFLLNPDAKDERRDIEAKIRELAVLSVNEGVTIVLICHPNNLSVAHQRRVKLTDCKGASAIRQDAHIGVVVERVDYGPDKPVKYPASRLHFDKVRSEFGRQGSEVVLFFDLDWCSYVDNFDATPTYIANEQSESKFL